MLLQRSMSEPPQRTSEFVKNALPGKLLQAKNPTQKPKLRRQGLINKVPNLLRLETQNPQFYEPVLASLGPYHHGNKKFECSENFKIKTLELFVADSGKDVECFYSMVLAQVDYARTCYVQDSTHEYDDPTFAQMMLLDASFIINFIVLHLDADRLDITGNHLGELVYAVLWCDLLLLENQIPFRVLKDLILLGYGGKKGQEMLRNFLSLNILGVCRQEHWKYSASDDEQPTHLLDAFWSIIVSDPSHDPALTKSPEILSSRFRFLKRVGSGLMSSFKTHTRRRSESLPITNPDRKDCKNEDYGEPEWVKTVKKYIRSYRTVTDLKEKGIHFRPQSGYNLNAIKFHSGYLSAHVEVPTLYIFEYTKVVVSNMIAHELCRTSRRVFAAYIDFMASLIDSAKDVKELREQKILFTTLKSDDEVAILCKEINLLGWKNGNIFVKVKEDIQAHYDSYGKTWLAELNNTYFRTPWTIVALIVATLLIVLTFLQTYYTMK